MKWISVKDRLPDLYKTTCEDSGEFFESQDVLAFYVDEYGESRQIVAYFERDDTGYFYTGWVESSEGVQINNVTHWMLLPEPPKA